MNADMAWARLSAALRDSAPGCAGLDIFTADQLTGDQLDFCDGICTRCPVFDLCDAFALAARVQAGFWAGRLFSPKATTTAPGGLSRHSHEQEKST